MIEIREEKQEDNDEVRMVNDQAFGQTEEGRIVDKLRETCNEVVSLVAVSNNKIIGYIFFSPVTIDIGGHSITGIGLAPMAVLPGFQNQGIGTMLVIEGVRRIKKTACPFIVVLGHENYYPRFGFKKASKYGLKPQWERVPDGAFMAMILNESEMRGISGIVKYRDEFNEAM